MILTLTFCCCTNGLLGYEIKFVSKMKHLDIQLIIEVNEYAEFIGGGPSSDINYWFYQNSTSMVTVLQDDSKITNTIRFSIILWIIIILIVSRFL